MKPKETTITLTRADLNCLDKGGMIEYKIADGRDVCAVVNLRIDEPARRPAN